MLFRSALYNGKIIQELNRYDAEDQLKESRKLMYRESHPEQLLEETVVDKDNNTELRTVYLEDEAGSVTYNKEGKVHTRQKMVYDEKKRLLENSNPWSWLVLTRCAGRRNLGDHGDRRWKENVRNLCRP